MLKLKLLFIFTIALLTGSLPVAAEPDAALVQKISRTDFAKYLESRGVRTQKITLTDAGRAAPAALVGELDGRRWTVRFYYCETPDSASGCLDFQFRATFDGLWSGEFVDEWNSTRRFGRVYKTADGVGVSSDVNIEGGVTREFLRVMTDVWFEMTGLVDEARVMQDAEAQ